MFSCRGHRRKIRRPIFWPSRPALISVPTTGEIADPIGKRLVHHAAGVKRGVQADHVVQRQRAHRHAELASGPFDGLGLDAVQQQLDRFVQIRQQQAIDQESRARRSPRSATCRCSWHRPRPWRRFVAGLPAADHFDQRHLAHGVEKMDAAEPLRVLQAFGQLADRNRRGVRGQDRLRPQARFEPGEDLPLDFQDFRQRLRSPDRPGPARRRWSCVRARRHCEPPVRGRAPWFACCTSFFQNLAARAVAAPPARRR